jgi:hypothetical protein
MRVLGLVLALCLVCSVGYAEGHGKYKKTTVNNYSTFVDEINNEYGAKLDAPYLVKIIENVFLGVEGGKNLYNTATDEGWFAYGKVTYIGTLLDLTKRK